MNDCSNLNTKKTRIIMSIFLNHPNCCVHLFLVLNVGSNFSILNKTLVFFCLFCFCFFVCFFCVFLELKIELFILFILGVHRSRKSLSTN